MRDWENLVRYNDKACGMAALKRYALEWQRSFEIPRLGMQMLSNSLVTP